ncbi:CDK-activating kinase assembly factor MAT1-like isoform X3 [Artemia franciscana]|uniref:RING-type domain-containing protein n=1 Tax=Artemia franciscana TaxID=6661 RepID=A0AA88HC86_ARTSF|nr:hypothetical protein QYM36_013131 [Artemia franciscana]KAK2709360.1 hypothetical protein QYM36_013131 [Artemia franciscana]
MDDFGISEEVCPVCKTNKSANPNLVLMVNVCVHPICENCVATLFRVGGAGKCPVCKNAVKTKNYRVKLFRSSYVEKDVDIRKRIKRDFNKHREDFGSLREYNDYLEMVEDIICNLVNGVDIIETNKKIENYKKENKDLIMKNRNRPSEEEQELTALVEEERKKITDESYVKEEIEEKRRKRIAAEALIDELIVSNIDGKKIFESHVAAAQKSKEEEIRPSSPKITRFSSGATLGTSHRGSFLPLPKPRQHQLFVYQPPVLDLNGPLPPSAEDIKKKGFLKHIRSATTAERAGGYSEITSCMRALQEAMSGLFYVPRARLEVD